MSGSGMDPGSLPFPHSLTNRFRPSLFSLTVSCICSKSDDHHVLPLLPKSWKHRLRRVDIPSEPSIIYFPSTSLFEEHTKYFYSGVLARTLIAGGNVQTFFFFLYFSLVTFQHPFVPLRKWSSKVNWDRFGEQRLVPDLAHLASTRPATSAATVTCGMMCQPITLPGTGKDLLCPNLQI